MTDVTHTLGPVRRGYVADEVLRQLGGFVLAGGIAVGDALPPERVLAARFGASRLLVRQAIHRLAEMGLLEVRQGAATRVRDVRDATDVRVVELLYGPLRPTGTLTQAERLEIIEKQYMQGLALIEVAARRASASELAAVCEAVAEDPESVADFEAAEARFWRALARASHNRIYEVEVAWWYRVLGARHERPALVNEAPLAVRIGFLRELGRRLVEKEDATAYYLATIRPVLAALTTLSMESPE